MNILINHFRNSGHKGIIADPDLVQEVVNRKCGDKLSFTARISEGKIQEINYRGEGCFYCIASASIACKYVQGQSIEKIREDISDIRNWLKDKDIPDPDDEEICALGEIRQFPMRIDCVDLAWLGLEKMLNENKLHSRLPDK